MLGFKKKIIMSKLKFSLKFKTQHSKDFSKKKNMAGSQLSYVSSEVFVDVIIDSL